MKNKRIWIGLLAMLLSSTLAVQGLVAQEGGSGKLGITTGIGFQMAFPILTKDGQDLYDDRRDTGYDEQTFLGFGGRIPFTMAFPLAGPYSLGFGAYIGMSYEMAKLEGKLEALGDDSSTLYERGVINLAPVFYNELALGKMFALSLAIGPSFTFTFGDKNTTEVDGSSVFIDAIEEAGTFERKDSFQFSFGMLVDLGFQIKFNPTIGLGIDTFFQLYFSGQKTARGEEQWEDNQTYQGRAGGTISFLLFL